MKGLAGDFATMPLKDLVVYLGNRKATGTLHFESGQTRKYVSLAEGQVHNASSNDPREFLGQFLINMGHLSEDQFEKAYQTQKETKIFLGKILVMIGLVSEPVIQTALNLKFRETVLEAFNWSEGMFTFDPDERPTSMDGLEVKVDLLDIHREAEFRETAWLAIRMAFPTGNVRLTVDEARFPEPPRPGSLDDKLIRHIREGLTIDGIILALHASPFFLYQRLYALYRLEAVQISEVVQGEALSEPDFDFETPLEQATPADALLHDARQSLEQGNLREAESLARRAHDQGPSPDTTQLLRQCEAALLGELRRELTEQSRIPSLLLPPNKLRTLSLTAPERYLLSRIDGQRDVGAIVHVSPLQELDALKFFQNFLDAGLIQLTGI